MGLLKFRSVAGSSTPPPATEDSNTLRALAECYQPAATCSRQSDHVALASGVIRAERFRDGDPWRLRMPTIFNDLEAGKVDGRMVMTL